MNITVQQTYWLESNSLDLGTGPVAEPPGSNTSESEELDSSMLPRDTLYSMLKFL